MVKDEDKLTNELDEVEYQRKLEVLKTRWQSRPDFLHYLFSTWLNLFAHKFCRVWTSQVLHFGVKTMNRAESEHSVLKLWLSTCQGDLDTVFFNIDSLIQGQIAKIKYALEISRLKEKYGSKSNPIVKNLSNKISHLGLKKIMNELKKARQMVEEPGTVVNPPETAVTKGLRKMNSTERDKSHWEYVSIAHRKIGKSSGSGSGSGSGSDSSSNPSRGRGRPPRSGRGRGRGRSSGRSSLSTVVSPDSPSVPFLFNNAFPVFMYQFIQNWKNVVGNEYHRDMRVSGWTAQYRNRMADWVTRYREMYPPQRHFM
ncbi:hypothetical protein M9H77_32023 [Catharanthus roseus]|uniref:Uncharacterized protein n=1 Tax=Catharanthus roseus TaxID=4058 RepID=A0ACC0A248_CATRO|nr:hypothetical protein M9H77_32023 [Catharanthus roseus]